MDCNAALFFLSDEHSSRNMCGRLDIFFGWLSLTLAVEKDPQCSRGTPELQMDTPVFTLELKDFQPENTVNADRAGKHSVIPETS